MRKYLFIFAIVFLLASCGKKTTEAKPERRDVTETVFASGILEPEGKYNLTAQSDGYIVALKFDEGNTVKENQVLAIIDNKTNLINLSGAENLLGLASINASAEGPTLKQAGQNVQLLKERLDQDSVQHSRYQKLFQSNSVSKLELENTKLAFESSRINYQNATQNFKLLKQQTEQQLIQQRSQTEVNKVSTDYNQVKAVVGGKIYKRLKEAGDFVRRGDVIVVIGSPDYLYCKLSIDETTISKVKPGQPVLIQLNINKEKSYKGVVHEIYPSFDEQTQSFYCKVLFTDSLDFKISGTQLQANIIISRKKNALVIPRNFLQYGNKVNVKGKGEITVKTGFVSNEWVEILDGLDEHAEIISDHKP